MSADRYTMPVDEEGQPDYESPDCLDVPRLNRDLNDLFAGREVSLPTYNFITRRSVESGAKIELKKGDVVIMEGLHALNPMIHFPDDTLRSLRVYVSPADVIVDETRGLELSNQYIRLCRRIYRDRDQRGSSEEETIERSRSVNRGASIRCWAMSCSFIAGSCRRRRNCGWFPCLKLPGSIFRRVPFCGNFTKCKKRLKERGSALCRSFCARSAAVC